MYKFTCDYSTVVASGFKRYSLMLPIACSWFVLTYLPLYAYTCLCTIATWCDDRDDKITNSDDLEMEFAITTNKIKQELCSSHVDVVSVVEQLQVCSAVKDKNIPLFDEEVLENVSTVEKLWQKLNKFWSIFDYDVLRFLLRFAKCKKAVEIFDKFLSRIDVASMEDVDLVLHCKVIESQGLMKPLLRIKVKTEKFTSYTERRVREIVSSKFDLENYSLRFRGIKQGCIELLYKISNATMVYLLQCKLVGYDLKNLAAYDIISFHINNMELKLPSAVDVVCKSVATCTYGYIATVY